MALEVLLLLFPPFFALLLLLLFPLPCLVSEGREKRYVKGAEGFALQVVFDRHAPTMPHDHDTLGIRTLLLALLFPPLFWLWF